MLGHSFRRKNKTIEKWPDTILIKQTHKYILKGVTYVLDKLPGEDMDLDLKFEIKPGTNSSLNRGWSQMCNMHNNYEKSFKMYILGQHVSQPQSPAPKKTDETVGNKIRPIKYFMLV